MTYIVVTVTAALVGLVLGFLIGKRATRWCPVCGLTLSITHCPAHGWPVTGSSVRKPKAVQR